MVDFGSRKQSHPYSLSTLEKGLAVLSMFGPERTTLTQADIAREIETNKTSAHRFARTLLDLGFLSQDPRTKLLRLGPRALRMAVEFIQGYDLLAAVKPIVDQAFDRLDVTIDLAVLDSDGLFILYRRESSQTLTFRLPPAVNHLHSNALGKALLAFLPQEEAEQLLPQGRLARRTDRTITTRKGLAEDLARTRERGYATNNEEYVPGLVALGAPLLNHRGNGVMGVVSFDSATALLSLTQLEQAYAGELLALAAKLSTVIPPG